MAEADLFVRPAVMPWADSLADSNDWLRSRAAVDH